MSLHIHIIRTWMSNAFLIESATALVLIDTGPPRSEQTILRRMKHLGCTDLQLIFLTHAHYDHFGSAAALKRLTGAPIAINRIDADALARAETKLGSIRGIAKTAKLGLPLLELCLPVQPIQADILVDDGDLLTQYGFNAQVIHTPGHTLGSSTLLVNEQHAFVGDLISTLAGPRPQRYFAVDWQQLATSLQQVQQLGPELIYCGHGPQPLSGPRFQQIEPAKILKP